MSSLNSTALALDLAQTRVDTRKKLYGRATERDLQTALRSELHKVDSIVDYKNTYPTTKSIHPQFDKHLFGIIDGIVAEFSSVFDEASTVIRDEYINCFLVDFGMKFALVQRYLKRESFYREFDVVSVVSKILSTYLGEAKRLVNFDKLDDKDLNRITLEKSRFRQQLKSIDVVVFIDRALGKSKDDSTGDSDDIETIVLNLRKDLERVKPFTNINFEYKNVNEQQDIEASVDEKVLGETFNKADAPFVRYLIPDADIQQLQIDNEKLLSIIDSEPIPSEANKRSIKEHLISSLNASLKYQEQKLDEPKTPVVNLAYEDTIDENQLDFHRYEELDESLKMAYEQTELLQKLFDSLPNTYESFTADYGFDNVSIPAIPSSYFSLLKHSFLSKNKYKNLQKNYAVHKEDEGEKTMDDLLFEYTTTTPTDFIHNMISPERLKEANEIKNSKLSEEDDEGNVKEEYKRGFWTMKVLEEIRLTEEVKELRQKENTIDALVDLSFISHESQLVNDRLQHVREHVKSEEIDFMQLQDRLQAIWTKFEIPLVQRIRMAIKYGHDKYKDRLKHAVELWESAFDGIVKREELLKEICEFEATMHGYSHVFVSEMRLKFTEKLHEIDDLLSAVLIGLYVKYGDVVTYKGSVYREKMFQDLAETSFASKK